MQTSAVTFNIIIFLNIHLFQAPHHHPVLLEDSKMGRCKEKELFLNIATEASNWFWNVAEGHILPSCQIIIIRCQSWRVPYIGPIIMLQTRKQTGIYLVAYCHLLTAWGSTQATYSKISQTQVSGKNSSVCVWMWARVHVHACSPACVCALACWGLGRGIGNFGAFCYWKNRWNWCNSISDLFFFFFSRSSSNKTVVLSIRFSKVKDLFFGVVGGAKPETIFLLV